jgi:hypothetical protein
MVGVLSARVIGASVEGGDSTCAGGRSQRNESLPGVLCCPDPLVCVRFPSFCLGVLTQMNGVFCPDRTVVDPNIAVHSRKIKEFELYTSTSLLVGS